MTDEIGRIGALMLAQVTTALPDTIFTKQVVAEHGWFEQVTGIASGLMSVALLALAAFLIPAAWNFRSSHKKMNQLLERVYGDINPLMRHASSIADNLDYITTSVRTDVQQINATIAAANQRLNQAVTLTEERMSEFNALLAVMQREAEGIFVSTASTARGIRAGAAAFARDVENGTSPGLVSREPVEDSLSTEDEAFVLEALEALDGTDTVDDTEEEIDGDDDYRAPGEAPPHPRIRPRGSG
jgi:uncharacterized protein YoxC